MESAIENTKQKLVTFSTLRNKTLQIDQKQTEE